MGKRYAIAIGINDYKIEPLDYCVKDAKDILNTLVNHCHVERANIREITSERQKPNANTWETFCHTIDNLKNEFAPEDDLFFFFSGHGVSNSTQTIVKFGEEEIGINLILEKINEISPQNIIMIFDSCFSGVGLQEKEKSAQLFSAKSNSNSGYNILTSCSKTQTAKETQLDQNGRFTRFLIDTICDLANYNKEGDLDLARLYSLSDTFFRNNPDFEQNPFIEMKSLGSYPIANRFNDSALYKSYQVKDPSSFDWETVKQSLYTYIDAEDVIIANFLRLISEQAFNVCDSSKGNTDILHILIKKNHITLWDEGNFFDLFLAQKEIKEGGGMLTAKMIKENFSHRYIYKKNVNGKKNIYQFTFIPDEFNNCSFIIDDIYSRANGQDIVIDETCESYTIILKRHGSNLSAIMSLVNIHKLSKENKPITIRIHEDDKWIADIYKKNIEDSGIKNIEVIQYKS